MSTPEEIQKAEDDRIAAEADKKTADELAAERKTETTVPYSRFNEEVEKKKELEKRLAAIEKANKEAEEKRLMEAENYRELADKRQAEIEALKPKAAVAEESEKTLKAVLDAQIEELPEPLRAMVPEELTTSQKLNWLSKNKSLLLKPKAFDIGAGKNGGGAPQQGAELAQEEIQMANKFGMSPEEYAKYK